MDEVLTKISLLLRDHLPSPGNGGWKGRRIERDEEEGEEATEEECAFLMMNPLRPLI